MNDQERLLSIISNSSDEELKSLLESLGRIKSENLDLGVKLLRQIINEEDYIKLAEKLCSDVDGKRDCVGAVDPAMILMRPNMISELTFVVSQNIQGVDFAALWSDCSHKDINLFMFNIWALQCGVYAESEIKENFKVNHLDSEQLKRVTSKDHEWFFRANRPCVLPFVYGVNVINHQEFLKKEEDFNPYSENFKKFV